MRPEVGFRVATPHSAAGHRRDPVASEPWAKGTIPQATAAAGPPLEPPTDRERSQGLRVGSKPGGSVVTPFDSGGQAPFPIRSNPAASS